MLNAFVSLSFALVVARIRISTFLFRSAGTDVSGELVRDPAQGWSSCVALSERKGVDFGVPYLQASPANLATRELASFSDQVTGHTLGEDLGESSFQTNSLLTCS